jgi:hypothetical protein
MVGKLKWVVGFGAGYVLGARAGRARYDQIAGKAQQLWSDPRVQAKAGRAQQVVMEKADQAQQVVKEKVAEKTSGNGAGAHSGASAAYGASASTGTAPSPTRTGTRSGAGGAQSS